MPLPLDAKLKVLVVGGGGREHALAWKIAASPRLGELLIAPGNAGTRDLGDNVPVQADDVVGLIELARARAVDLVVVGPEAPLAGLADRLAELGIPCVGPGAGAAQIEGSKGFAKEIMAQAGVPTAAYAVFSDLAAAEAYVHEKGAPIVVKADGLAAGKGVTVATTVQEAMAAVRQCLVDDRFGAAGAQVLIEEHLRGVETSFMVLTDGRTVLPLPTSKDHKRLLDGDAGPNTGGMGAVSPSPHLTAVQEQTILAEVMRPVIAALSPPGALPYRGFLYAGLMLPSPGAARTPGALGGPRVLEFNCRLGDPETQPLMLRLQDDSLLSALYGAATGTLSSHCLPLSDDPAAVVVMASEGYPGPYDKGHRISGLPAANAVPGVTVFHAGTRPAGAGDGGDGEDPASAYTSGGRVLGVTASGPTLEAALGRAYAGVAEISWPGAQHRTDIGRT